MRKYLAPALVLPLLLVGCGSDPKTSSKAAPSPSETVVKVSDATICGLAIDDNNAPFPRAIDVMKKDYEFGDIQDADAAADDLEKLAHRAESDVLATNLQAMANELRAIFDDEKTDSSDFKAAALEVNNVCGSTVRF